MPRTTLVLPSRLGLLAALLLVLGTAAPAAGQAPSTTRVSVSSAGAEGKGASSNPAISADGRYVAFYSEASDLVPGDSNMLGDVFVRDRRLGETVRINLGPGGVQANGATTDVDMSGDGRFVVWTSEATNLVAPATTAPQAFLWDRATGTVRRVSSLPAPYGAVAAGIDISTNGARVGFAGQGGPAGSDAFVADTAGGPSRRVSEKPDGSAGNGASFRPSLSGDGRWAAFSTAANDLVPGDANGKRDVVAVDLDTGARVRASIAAGGAVEPNGDSDTPGLDGNGCRIAFTSNATNLVADDDESGVQKAWVRDRCAGETELVSRADSGAGQGTGFEPRLSDDGCVAVFATRGPGVLSPPPPSGRAGLARRDRCTGRTSRLDVSTSGDVPAAGGVVGWEMSAGSGRYIAFDHDSSDLLPGDGNGTYDVFVRDRATNAKPSAVLTVTVGSGGRVDADASGSSDPDGFLVTGQIDWNDGSPSDAGLRATHVYRRPGVYTVTATITDADGAQAFAFQNVTVGAGSGGEPPQGGGAPGGDGPPGGGAPGGGAPGGGSGTSPRFVLDRVSLSRRTFAVVARGSRPSGRRGALLRLRLSDPARVRLVFQRAQRGRRRGSRCVAGARRGRRCTHWRTVAATSRNLPTGASTVPVTGRIGSRKLAPGSHRLVVSARAPDGRRSATRVLPFTVTAGR